MMTKKKHNAAFGRVLQTLRIQKTWSQEALGFEATLTRTTISLLERGQRSPTLNTMVLLCDALGVGFDSLAQMIKSDMESKETAGDE